MEADFLFLGTGGSAGVPMIGCHCPVCLSKDSHNQRLRPSALLTASGKKILIDAGPDLRTQALRSHIDFLDGVLLTHAHFDHIAGLDELRTYYLMHRKALPVLLSRPTYDDVRHRFDYFFQEKSWERSLTAQLEFTVLEQERGMSEFLGLPIQFMRYEQAAMPVTGYRFGPLAYLSDIRQYPESIFEDLRGVKILIISCLREASSMMHFSVEEAIDFARKVGAEKTYLTHMSHELEHHKTNARLPGDIQLAYDGLSLRFTYGKNE